jgi:hypothetical protein
MLLDDKRSERLRLGRTEHFFRTLGELAEGQGEIITAPIQPGLPDLTRHP